MATKGSFGASILRRFPGTVFLGLPLLLACPVKLSAQSYATPGFFETGAEGQMVALINQARRQQGVAPLAVDPRLTEAARKHSQLMAQQTELAHQLPGEPSPQDRIAAENVASDRQGENVALDQNAFSAHEGLMHSPPHRRNILDPEYDAVGIGVIRRGHDIYVTEDFARLLPRLSEPQAETAVQNALNRYMSSQGFGTPAAATTARHRLRHGAQ